MIAASEAPGWVLFGGSFDPPHAGHVGMVRLVLKALPQAEVSVLPAPKPAGAGGAHKSPVASFEQRVVMCRLAFAELGDRVDVATLEAELPPPNYTVNVLERARHERSNARLGLLLGEDQVDGFARWHAPERIAELAMLVVVARGTDPNAPRTPAAAAERLRAAVPNARVVLVPGHPPPAASRLIRAAFAAHQPPAAGWLPPAVASYIAHAKLYGQAGA